MILEKRELDATTIRPRLYTVPDTQGHDTKLNTFKMSVALKFILILHNLTTENHRKSGESKYDR